MNLVFAGINECDKIETNNCTQGCIDDIIGFHCQCRTGYTLLEDGTSCKGIIKITMYKFEPEKSLTDCLHV